MNILILRVSSIGDVIHTLPALFLIKHSFPNAQISWIVQKKASSILINQPFLQKVWIIPDDFLYPKNWLETVKIIRQVKKTRWDVILDFQGITKTSILSLFFRGTKYGFDAKHAKLPASSMLQSKQTTPTYKNIIQKNLALASDMIQEESKKIITSCPATGRLHQLCTLHFSEKTTSTVNKWIAKNNIKRSVLLSPNTTWESKHWPVENWKKLFLLLTSNSSLAKKHSIVLVGAFFGKQAKQLSAVIKKQKLNIHILPCWNLISTCYFISKSKLTVAPDTGLLHVADYLNKKSIGIFGPTCSIKHGPFLKYENCKSVIQVPCSHFYQKTHGKSKKNKKTGAKKNCMYKLYPEVLYKNIVQILQR